MKFKPNRDAALLNPYTVPEKPDETRLKTQKIRGSKSKTLKHRLSSDQWFSCRLERREPTSELQGCRALSKVPVWALFRLAFRIPFTLRFRVPVRAGLKAG